MHAEETFVRFLAMAPHTLPSHYLPKYQITRNSRIVSEQPIYNMTWSFVNSVFIHTIHLKYMPIILGWPIYWSIKYSNKSIY